MQLQRLAQEGAEGGQQDLHQRQRHQQRDHGHQQGFAQKLHDQLCACRAQGLAQGDFARPQRYPRRRKVHEVEAGHQEYQHPDGADAGDGGPAAGRGGVVAPLCGIQMHLGEGCQVDRENLPCRDMQADLAHFRAQVAVDQRPHGCCHRIRVGTRRQPHEIPAILGVPIQPGLLRHAIGKRSVGHKDIAVELGIVRQVTQHARHLQGDDLRWAGGVAIRATAAAGGDRLADGIGIAEILAHRLLAQHHRIGLAEDGGRIARHQGQLDDREEFGVDAAHAFEELAVAHRHGHRFLPEAGHADHAGDFVAHGRRHGEWRHRQRQGSATGDLDGFFQPIQVVTVRNPFVIGQLIAHEQKDEEHAGQPKRQAGDVDEAEQLVPGDGAQGGDQVVVEHGLSYSARRAWMGLARATRRAWLSTVPQAITSAPMPAMAK